MSSEQADFAAELAQRDAGARLYVTSLAVQAHVHRGYAHHIEHGYRTKTATPTLGRPGRPARRC